MAEKYLVANGNWSNAASWNGGTKPLAADDVYSNNFTGTIDENVNVNSLRATAGSVAVAGGQFTTSGTLTIDVADAVYGFSNNLGSLRLNSGATLNGNAVASGVGTRQSVRIEAGAVMNGNAAGADAVVIQGGVMNGNATGAARNNPTVTINSGGVMNGNGTGSSTNAVSTVQVSTGGKIVGNATGGSVNNGFGVNLLSGACQIGNSVAGTSGTSHGTDIRSGGVQIGNAAGGSNSSASGTICSTGGLFFGDATGGTVSGSHGLSISSGFAQVGTATGNTSGAFGVSATNFCEVIIAAESGSFAKSLGANVTTNNSRYPFVGSSGGASRPVNPFTQQVIG